MHDQAVNKARSLTIVGSAYVLAVAIAAAWLVAVLVVVWSARLTGNWVHAFPGLHHEDWRYPMLRERAGRGEFVGGVAI